MCHCASRGPWPGLVQRGGLLSLAGDRPAVWTPGWVVWTAYGLAMIGTPLPAVAEMGPPGPAMELLALVAIAVALVVLGLVARAPGAFEVKSSRSPTRVTNLFLLIPSAGLMVAGFTSPLVFPQVVLLTGAAGAALALLIGLWTPRASQPTSAAFLYVFLGLYGAGCGIGAPPLVNRRFDHSQGQVFQAVVEGRRITSGKGGLHYNLQIGPWGPRTAPSTVPVSQAVYDATRPGDTACVTLHPGALLMPWYLGGRC